MNKETLAGQWRQLKGEAKAKWAKLTDDDISRIGGNYDKLVGSLQERYGYMKEDAMNAIDEWSDRKSDSIAGDDTQPLPRKKPA